MFRFSQPKDNAVSATYQYLKAIGAKVTEETVEETLKNHPNYPSLLATSDAFNEWKIENVAARITPEQLGELPTPFLTHLYVDGGIFALVKSVKNDAVEWTHTKEGFKRDKTEDFLKKWNGVVLMAEINTDSGEKNFTENNKKEILSNLRTPVLLLGATLLVIFVFYYNFSTDWHYNAILLTKLAGVIISSLLLWQSIDKNNPFIKNLCQAGGKANCNAILSSNAAQATTWLSWSEVGFFYFTGGFIALLLNPASTFTLWGLGGCALFYTFWSIYYQAFVAKQWCPLCLTVQGLFVVEFLININFISELGKYLQLMTVSDFLAPLSGVGVAVLFWVFIKPFLQKSQQVVPLKNDLKRFKNNPNLFLSLLEKQAEMPFVPTNMHTINFGNPNAKHTLTMVTNTFCQPCAKTHKIIEELLESNENLNCQVVFLASNMADDKRGIVAKLILSLPIHQQAEALHQWYENEERSIEKWQKQLGVIENKNTESTISQHQVWCETAKIEATPTLYLDGFKMPELYRLWDLKGVIKFLPKTVA
jgi:uncharacterized membrane protein